MRRQVAAMVAASLLWMSGAHASPEASDAPTAVERLEAAVAAHPDEAALHWALGLELLASGEPERAAEVLAAYGKRWPGHRADLDLQLGQALYRAGRLLEALAAFDRAALAQPEQAAPQIFRALVLRRLDRVEEADDALLRAAAIDPELEAETLVMRGVQEIERGRTRRGVALLRDAVELDPDTDAARRARRWLRERPRPSRPRLIEASLYGGFESDSNVTLDSGTDLPGVATDQEDLRGLVGTGLTVRPVRGETLGLALGYRFDRSFHDELDDFDTQSHLAYVSGTWRPRERLALRLDGIFRDTRLGGDPFSRTFELRPNLLLGLGERAGVLRLHLHGESLQYDEKPLLSSLERDGWEYGAGFDHTLALPFRRGAWTSWSGAWSRYDSSAERDLFGLDGAFDHHRFEARLRAHVPLVWKIEADLGLGYGREIYDHRNAVDFLTDDGVGNLDPRERRDHAFEARITVSRAVTRFADLELAWRYLHRLSNVDLYDYDRTILGAYVRLHTF